MTRMKVPEGNEDKVVSAGGRDFPVTDGVVEVPDSFAGELEKKGFTKEKATAAGAQPTSRAGGPGAGADQTPSGARINPGANRDHAVPETQGNMTAGGAVTPSHPPTQPHRENERGGVAGSPNAKK